MIIPEILVKCGESIRGEKVSHFLKIVSRDVCTSELIRIQVNQ